MDKVGFIGYGSMGSMMIDGFISAKALSEEQIFVSTHTKEKLSLIKERWNGVNTVYTNTDVVKNAKYIFLCVKPLQVKSVLKEIKEFIKEDQVVISITGCVTIGNIESITTGKVAKVIPSLTSEVGEGVSLVCYNAKVNEAEKEFIQALFNSISNVKLINENDFEVGTDLTSCAPGLIAAMFQQFVEAGLRHSSFSKEEVEEMVLRTLYGTAKLLYEKNMKFDETIKRVATKGGITEEGVIVLRDKLPEVFDILFEKTINKHETVKKVICEDFSS